MQINFLLHLRLITEMEIWCIYFIFIKSNYDGIVHQRRRRSALTDSQAAKRIIIGNDSSSAFTSELFFDLLMVSFDVLSIFSESFDERIPDCISKYVSTKLVADWQSL